MIMYCMGTNLITYDTMDTIDPFDPLSMSERIPAHVPAHIPVKISYMSLCLKELKYYYLTHNNPMRKAHYLKEFKEFNPKEINPVPGIPRFQSGATGFARMIDKGLRDQNRLREFQSFVLMEDDCSKFRKFPDHINVPVDADLLYIGISRYGMVNNGGGMNVFVDPVDQNIVRVNNMLSSHGIIICSAAGASLMTKCLMESYYKNTPWDIPIAQILPYYKAYALKIPLVYQDKDIGGQEYPTYVTVSEDWIKSIPDDIINKTNPSVIMNQF